MAKTKLSEYSATASSNTDINSINIDEGMSPSNVNNAIRELMAQLKNMEDGTDAVTAIKSGNIQITSNTISSTDTNGNINITPNGTGSVVLDGINYPQADGTANHFLKTDGAGQLSFAQVDTASIADGSITTAKIADGDITDAKLATGISSSKLTGALPAIDGSALTGLGVADGSITTAKLADLAVTDAKISGMSSSKLSGALPAIDGSALTGISSGITVSAYDYTGNDGYVKYSDGLIWQWGYKSDTGTSMTVYYPISFPNRVFNVQMQMIRNSVNYQNTTLSSGYATSLSSFFMRWDSYGDGIIWVAVGN